MPNCVLKLMDDDENEVPQGTRGEIWVQCPNVMKGYWRNPKATADTITADGWLKTGDVAYRDAEGRYYIVDRKKELIKVKGVQVAPAELESLLLDHPQVADAAVIGVKGEEDEVPRAYIVPKSEGAVTARDILEYMEGKVSRIKRLSGGIVFTDAIPKNPVRCPPSPLHSIGECVGCSPGWSTNLSCDSPARSYGGYLEIVRRRISLLWRSCKCRCACIRYDIKQINSSVLHSTILLRR
jgi:hypothetical protein